MAFDNGHQFDINKVWDYCADHDIQTWFIAITIAQMNGQAKSINKEIFNGLKRKLDGLKGL